MKLVETSTLAMKIEAEAERDAAAIRKMNEFRLKPLVRRRDSRDRTRRRPAA